MAIEQTALVEQKLHPKKTKSILFLLLTLVFFVIGIMMIIDGEQKGWFVSITFGIGTLIFIVNLLPQASYLLLDKEGFEMCSMFRKHRYKWNEVAYFTVGSISNNKMVMFDFVPGYTKAKKGRKIASVISGAEAALHDTFGLKAEELAALMNAYKVFYTKNEN